MTGVQRLLPGVFLFALLAGFWLPVSAQIDSEDAYDNLWSKARVYTGDDDSFFQSIDLSGRLQLDLAYVDSQVDSHHEFNVRRFRFGFKARFLDRFTFHLEGEFDPQDSNSFYTRLTDAYLGWAFSETGMLKAGKQSAGFTLDGMTSSKKLLTVERNNLTNNIWFTEEYIPGIGVKGDKNGLQYFAGIFSSGNGNPEFGDFTGGQFGLLTLGHDFAATSGAKQALLRLNLVYNEPDPDNGFTNLLEKIASLTFSYEADASWGMRTDISAASGYLGQPDIWGFVVMPFYRFNEHTEVVARYTYVKSDGDNGVRIARYERSLVDGLGDRYTEVHLGFNYFWYGHKLKLQNGVQYLEMHDRANDGGAYSGWSWTTGFRVSW
jgi:phosphate-selective porin OprO/OprP